MRVAPNVEAEDRHVRDRLSELCPVLSRHKCAVRFIIEKTVDRPGHHEIEIEMQNISAQAAEIFLPNEHATEWAVTEKLGKGEGRHRHDLHAAFDAAWIVGQTDEAKVALGVALDHGVQPVDVLRPVSCAPLQANDGLRHRSIYPADFTEKQLGAHSLDGRRKTVIPDNDGNLASVITR